MTARIVILSAPSGGGKTVVTKELLKRRPELFGYSVSATTRQPRPGETDRQAYHFLTRAEFERRRQAGEFLESAEYAGELYLSIFLLPPSADVLMERLRGRRTESIEAVEQRITIAVHEVEVARNDIGKAVVYDHVVINADLDQTVNQILAIVSNPDLKRHSTGDMLRFFMELAQGLQLEARKLHDELKESQ